MRKKAFWLQGEKKEKSSSASARVPLPTHSAEESLSKHECLKRLDEWPSVRRRQSHQALLEPTGNYRCVQKSAAFGSLTDHHQITDDLDVDAVESVLIVSAAELAASSSPLRAAFLQSTCKKNKTQQRRQKKRPCVCIVKLKSILL